MKSKVSLSYQEISVGTELQNVMVIDKKDDFNVKRIHSMPGEILPHGKVVDFAGSKWLVTDVDTNNEVYASGEMQRCNYKLKWIDSDGNIIEKWCIVEDGTKYLIGEKSKDMMSIGDARIGVTIGKDEDTDYLKRGMRFLIDDSDSDSVLAYQITKPNKLYKVYDGKGVFRFILNEVVVTDDDNVELRIADYYSWYPTKKFEQAYHDPDKTLEDIVGDAKEDATSVKDDNKEVWL